MTEDELNERVFDTLVADGHKVLADEYAEKNGAPHADQPSVLGAITRAQARAAEYDDSAPAHFKNGNWKPGATEEVEAAGPVVEALHDLIAAVEFERAQIVTVLRSAFGRRAEGSFDDGRIALSQEIANILGWEEG
jgi:hypothetical protein